MEIDVLLVDYANESHCRDLVFLLNCYAMDPMGGGVALSSDVQHSLAAELAKVANAFSVICYVNDRPAGLVNCFQGFSTFRCQPLINIHDIAVIEQYRGRGISQLMLDKVASVARERGCCKLTLEVLEGNEAARKSYLKFGFAAYQLDPKMGKALFWQKPLTRASGNGVE